jgi:hypothetical protein
MPNQYFWVTGMDGHGAATTAGPYMSQREAEDATNHLRQVQVHILHTRQHDKARRILKARMQGGGGEEGGFAGGMPPHADEPMPSSPGLVQRFRDLIQPPRKDSDYDEDY